MDEQRQRRLGAVVKEAQQAWRVAMDHALRQHGVTTAQYAILSTLEETPGLSGAALARRCAVTPQTANEIIVHLEAAGLIARCRGADARILHISLSTAGRTALDTCQQAATTIDKQVAGRLTAREQQVLLSSLRRCIQALRALPPATEHRA
ncbi:MAG TPA: MarR family transcriptional regulator [Chloroflexota bacterium]|nr:MarR family transcriptional regulator [Chloroflexota bacterium]